MVRDLSMAIRNTVVINFLSRRLMNEDRSSASQTLTMNSRIFSGTQGLLQLLLVVAIFRISLAQLIDKIYPLRTRFVL
jgi:hypothetical protein